jgi:hypothetical protein
MKAIFFSYEIVAICSYNIEFEEEAAPVVIVTTGCENLMSLPF